MRIAYFSDCYFPTINGVSTSIETAASALQSSGQQVCLFLPTHPEQDSRSAPLAEVRLPSVVLPVLKDNRLGFPVNRAFWQAVKQRNFDLVHIHTPGTLGLLGLFYAKLRGLPYVFTHHTLFEEYLHYLPLPKKLTAAPVMAWMRMFWNNAQAVIAPSQSIAERLALQGLTVPCQVIPTAINAMALGCLEDKEANDPLIPSADSSVNRFCSAENNYHLLYVGRLAFEKSLDFLLSALKEIIESRPEAILTFVGDGPARTSLEKMAEQLGIQDHTRFVGWRPRCELAAFYRQARCFLFASQTETQGLVLLEAQTCGCPVVAVAAQGVNEAVSHGKGGFLVAPGNLRDYVDYTLELLNKEGTYHRLSRDAMLNAKAFAQEQMALQLSKLYQKITT